MLLLQIQITPSEIGIIETYIHSNQAKQGVFLPRASGANVFPIRFCSHGTIKLVLSSHTYPSASALLGSLSPCRPVNSTCGRATRFWWRNTLLNAALCLMSLAFIWCYSPMAMDFFFVFDFYIYFSCLPHTFILGKSLRCTDLNSVWFVHIYRHRTPVRYKFARFLFSFCGITQFNFIWTPGNYVTNCGGGSGGGSGVVVVLLEGIRTAVWRRIDE